MVDQLIDQSGTTETASPAEREGLIATYVLVHGAFVGSWCWSRLIPFLEAAGDVVYSPSLTGLGDREALLTPQVGLGTHVEDITCLICPQDAQRDGSREANMPDGAST